MSSPPQIVILSSIEWSAAWQRHQIFATQWAESGHDVFFVENTGFRDIQWSDIPRLQHKVRRLVFEKKPRQHLKPPRNLKVINPLVLPPTRPWFRRLNAVLFVPRLVEQLRYTGLRPGAVVFAYLPTATTLQLLDRLQPSKVVYDCVDNFYGLASAPADLRATEGELLKRSALVVTTSSTLRAEKEALHERVIELHQGVPAEFFLDAPLRSEYKRFCYFGTLWRAIDYEAIRALAEAGFEVTLIGPQKEPLPPLPASVRAEPALPYAHLPAALKRFDALLLPYVRSDYNRGVVPAKLYECLATGLPVIASSLPALQTKGDVLYMARSPADWAQLAAGLRRTEDERRRALRIDAARAQRHDVVFARLRSAVARTPAAPAPVVHSRQHVAELVGGITWIGFLYGLARATTLLTQIFAGRWLGPFEYGRANIAIALAAYVQILPIMGFPLAMSKLVASADDAHERDRLIATTLTLFAVWAAVWFTLLFALRGPVAALLSVGQPLFNDALLFGFCTAFYVVVSSPLLGLKRFDHRGVAEIIYGLSAPAVLFWWLSRGVLDYRALIRTLCVSLAFGSCYSLWALRRRLRPVVSLLAMRPIFEYAVVGAVNLLSMACIVAPARLLLHLHGTAQDVGVFSAYFMTSVHMALAAIYMANSAIVPLTSRAEGQAEAWRLLRRWAAPLFASGWAAFALAGAAALRLFGTRYPFVASWWGVFSLAAALILVHGVASALFAARDRRGLYICAAGNLLAGATNIAMSVFLIPREGVLGAGVALVAAYVLGCAPYLLALPRETTAHRAAGTEQTSYN